MTPNLNAQRTVEQVMLGDALHTCAEYQALRNVAEHAHLCVEAIAVILSKRSEATSPVAIP